MSAPRVVLDTNIFIAAGFKPSSASAQILQQVREGRLALVWDSSTRQEITHIARKIPPLSRNLLADLFAESNFFTGETAPAKLGFISDPADRKFAALAIAAEAALVTNDDHLLCCKKAIKAKVYRPSEFLGTI